MCCLGEPVELRSTGRAGAPVPTWFVVLRAAVSTRAVAGREPLRGRWPLELDLEFDFFLGMSGSAEGATHDGIAREGGRARALNLEGGGMNCMTGVKLARMRLLPARLRDISANALLSVALLSPSLNAVDHVEFTIFGRIRFSVPGDWPVIASKSDRNRTIFAFQVPNPADENTPDSTNLTIQSFYLRDPDSKSTFEKKSLKQDPSAQERKLAE